MNTSCFFLGSIQLTTPFFNVFTLAEHTLIPLCFFSSWGLFGCSLRTLCRIFVLGPTDPDSIQNEGYSAVLFLFQIYFLCSCRKHFRMTFASSLPQSKRLRQGYDLLFYILSPVSVHVRGTRTVIKTVFSPGCVQHIQVMVMLLQSYC